MRRCNDNLSASSSMEVDDRLAYLEQRVQLQEDEIQLLKAALADVLRRLGSCEEQNQGFGSRGGPTKVCHILQALPSKPFCNGYLPQKRMGGYPPSPSSPKKEMCVGSRPYGNAAKPKKPSSVLVSYSKEHEVKAMNASTAASVIGNNTNDNGPSGHYHQSHVVLYPCRCM
ncbi:hypothetical protein EOD39_3932 [Acipenser ruthenus]|uniref:Echinoderm microtubule-associated protein-like 1 n=1 Tax=Acipenser ruthenus TaxID=7906 RepID=A0A444UKM4_ACIRT|nr:hypothetical protein EOD39_3932 [Acipenser ruthenus]